MKPVRLYLDNSDYSVLSNPRRITPELESIVRQLRNWVAEGRIACFYSGTNLSEMAPLDAGYTDAAERRANLLVELCGRNALMSLDRVFASELRFALRQTDQPSDIISVDGEWYPEGMADMSPVGTLGVGATIKDTIRDMGCNRKARRLAERKALKRGKPRAALKAGVIANARSCSLDEVLEKYPMRPNDARVLSRYAVGDATAAEATAAFQESLRDPRWMMQWFRHHHDKLTPFTEWLRKPADALLASLQQMVDHAASIRRMDAAYGTELADSLFSSTKWKAWQDELLVIIANRMVKALFDETSPGLSPETIDERCPGFSVGIRSLHTAWFGSTSQTPRPPKPSDFPDALHAIYAPYVDIFRADSFMAPYIAKHSQRYGTRVVPKLSGLLPAIKSALDGRLSTV